MTSEGHDAGEVTLEVDRDRRWPRQLYAVGTEPDPRFSLANERTLLAWMRTSLALLALGVALDAFDDVVADGFRGPAAAGALVLALLCAISGARRWWVNERALRRTEPLTAPLSGIVLTVSLGGLALVLLTVSMTGHFR